MTKYAVALLTGALLATPAMAERVVIPVGEQAPSKQSLRTPTPGTTKEQVRKRFGDPVNVVPAVGDPPISSWEYKDYVVYFEKNRVLHTVLKRDQTPDQKQVQ